MSEPKLENQDPKASKSSSNGTGTSSSQPRSSDLEPGIANKLSEQRFTREDVEFFLKKYDEAVEKGRALGKAEVGARVVKKGWFED